MKFKITIKAKNENGKVATFREYAGIAATNKIEAVEWAERQAKEFGLESVQLDVVQA